MKRTDDFLADLEAQIGAASAGRLRPRRRVRVSHVLRPALVAATAAAAIFAFVLAAGSGGGDPERPAEPPSTPAASGGPFALEAAHGGECAVDGGDVDLPSLSVLRKPQSGKPATGLPHARIARADAPVTVVPMRKVGGCIDTGPGGVGGTPGACVIVDLDGRKSACWPIEEIDAGRAAAALGDGFVVALLPDRFEQATFVIGEERDTYQVTDNVVIANLDAAREGVYTEILAGTEPPPGCGEGTVEDGPLPEELLIALPALEGAPTQLPDPFADRLAKAGANRIWLGEARLLPREAAGGAVWLVPVADSRFAECGGPEISAPRAFEGPGACLVAAAGDEARSVLCVDLDDFLSMSTFPLGDEQVVLGTLPHWATGADVGGRRLENLGGIFAGRIPAGDVPNADYLGEGPPRHPVVVAGPRAEAARDLIAAGHIAADVRTEAADDGPTRVWYAAGMARDARRIAELLRVEDVLPMDAEARALAGNDTDVLVLAGEDLRP